MNKFLGIVVGVIAVGIIAFLVFNSTQTPQVSAAIVGLQANANLAGFARATQIREFKFPEDHGAHPEFQTEWWYYTGNLEATDGRRFGYQLTFFRRAITPTEPARASDWAANQIYFAHFAITDVKNNRHDASERFSRGAAGLSGASGNPFHVWIENWNVTSLNADGSQVQLYAEDEGRALNLTLASLKPVALQGNRGLSQKSADAGNASYYYSFTRLKTEGTLTIHGETITVNGLSWMDHEWSTAQLGADAVGWDWFSIQLSDKREVMLFQIRLKDGSIEPYSSGNIIEPDGTVKYIHRDQFDIKVLSTWTSNTTHATYPARWSISIPVQNIQLDLQPLIANQEMDVSIKYWEGAVEISGQSDSRTVSGKGYVEMTGYALQSAVPNR